jgi:hypothetical protein
MFRSLYLLIAVFLFTNQPSLVWSQTAPSCGNDLTAFYQIQGRYRANLQALSSKGQPETGLYIPLVFHLVANDQGAGRVAEHQVLHLFCALQEVFAPYQMQFYLKDGGLRYADNTAIFQNHHFTGSKAQMQTLADSAAVNLFILNNADPNGTPNSSVVGYYDGIRDWIVIRRSVVDPENYTTAHEIGHFFSLVHPHLGWDAEPWNPAVHGPVAPALAPGSGLPVEKMDGSNCATAGDMLCDTPPDYNFAIFWNDGCEYDGDARDPDSLLVDPDESLIMSYFPDDCRAIFSPEQTNLMHADLASPPRQHLEFQLFDSAAMVIADEPVLLSPIGVAIPPESVAFTWQATPKASHYLLEWDRLPGFNLEKNAVVLSDTFFQAPASLLSEKTYYWRVTPFNEIFTCAPTGTAQSFETTAPSSIREMARPVVRIFPNPAPAQGLIRITGLPHPAEEIQIYDGLGRLRWETGLTEPFIAFSLPDLEPGCYFFHISTSKNSYISRLNIF